ncbi:MAG: MoaD/ThiS family protein [Terrimicrobiaceae bacterium]|nr:MoaD/ThiS family protein [Terrimicrobiaceae bacterium]
MTTRVEFYAVFRDLTGASEIAVPLPEGGTVEMLLADLYKRFPTLAKWDERLVIAADLDYVERVHVIRPGEVISIIPPDE